MTNVRTQINKYNEKLKFYENAGYKNIITECHII